jgi:glutathione S-transferase
MRKYSETRTRYFMSLNPRHQCPVLILPNGVKMNESLAILSYLDRFGGGSAQADSNVPVAPYFAAVADLPVADQALAYAYAQESEVLGNTYEPLEEALFKGHPANPPAQLFSDALSAIDEELALWEARLTARWQGNLAAPGYLLGDKVCMADVAFFAVLSYLWRRGLQLEPRFPFLARYHAKMILLPCVQRAMPPTWDVERAKTNLFAAAARRAAAGAGAGAGAAGAAEAAVALQPDLGDDALEDDN